MNTPTLNTIKSICNIELVRKTENAFKPDFFSSSNFTFYCEKPVYISINKRIHENCGNADLKAKPSSFP